MKTLILLFSFLSLLSASAQLKWKTDHLVQTPHPLLLKGDYRFGFTNAGTEEVTMSGVRPSCGCVSIKLQQQTFAPGESGELIATFNYKGREADQRKTIVVTTSHGNYELVLEAKLKEALTFSDKRVLFTQDEEERRIKWVNQLSEPILIDKITSSSEELKFELITVREGFEYELVLKAEKPLRSVIRIYPVCASVEGELRQYNVYVQKR